ncbi:MAG: COG4315 family predicted lipoprotein [Nocardioidaceae bacterium]
MQSNRRFRLGMVALALAAAGCGSDDADETASTGSTTATSATSAPAPGVLRTASHAQFGTILVDGQGLTLYRNTEEAGTTIACTAACAVAWPPVLSSTTSAGDLQDVGTVTRPDGALQVTYQGMPLYRFAQDSKPGDTNGHGVGNIWLVVQAAGQADTAPAGSPTTAAPAAAATAATRPSTATTTRPAVTNAPAATTPTTGVTPTTAPPSTAPPTTTPPVTSPPVTSPPYTTPTTTGGTCEYPPCDP